MGPRGDAMVQLDWSVGEIMKSLEQHGLSENTIVIFTSDNGPVHHEDGFVEGMPVRKPTDKHSYGHDASGIWRGGKHQIYEGGTRVPMIFHWPGRIQPGTSDALVSQIDFLGSFASMLRIDLDKGEGVDSRNCLNTFMGKDQKGLPFLIEEASCQALRLGAWKYIPGIKANWAKGKIPSEDSLFNLKDDPSEQVNIIRQHPEKVSEMHDILNQYRIGKAVRKGADL